MKRIRELIDYIPVQGLEKAAGFLLTVWILTPLFILIYGTTLVNGDLFQENFNMMATIIVWFSFLQPIAIIGSMLGLIDLLKNIYRIRDHLMNWRQYLESHLVQISMMLLLLWSVLSCLFSGNISFTFSGTIYRREGLQTYLNYAGLFACGTLISDQKLVRRLLRFMTGVAVLLALLVLIDHDTLNDLFKLSHQAAIFFNINHFAYYLCLSIILSLALYLTDTNHAIRMLSFITYGIMIAALLQNRSLGPYLSICVGLVLCAVFILKRDKHQLPHLALAIVVFIGITLFITLDTPMLLYDLLQLSGDFSRVLKGSDDLTMVGSGRLVLWIKSLQFVMEKPLFGYGPDNLGARYVVLGIINDRPHNEYLQIAASLGIPALVFYLSALITHFVAFLKKLQQFSVFKISLFCALLTYLCSAVLGNTMFYTYSYFLLFLSVSIGMLRKDNEQATDGFIQGTNKNVDNRL